MAHQLTFLLVEDSSVIRSVVTKAITKCCGDSKLLVAIDGKEALGLMGKEKIDCIISDLNIDSGAMSGDEFITRLKSSGVFKNKKIIIFSSDNQNSILTKYPDIEYVDKASGIQSLTNKILAYMDTVGEK